MKTGLWGKDLGKMGCKGSGKADYAWGINLQWIGKYKQKTNCVS